MSARRLLAISLVVFCFTSCQPTTPTVRSDGGESQAATDSSEATSSSVDAPSDAPNNSSTDGTPDLNDLLVTDEVVDQPETFERVQGDAIHVRPGDNIQAALDEVSENASLNRVVVEAGTYRPQAPAQALIWFNAKHDGITLVARGEVVLSAQNSRIANRSAKSYPAIVNHVVYFGDGVSNRTTLRGFKITGANGYITTKLGPQIEPDFAEPQLKKTPFFYTDGGGIKIFARSYPTIEDCEIYDNYCSPCGAGISIEHRGYTDQAVIIRNCILRNNNVPLTGAALDLLGLDQGSHAIVENCLFIENSSNCPLDKMSTKLGSWKPKDGHGAVTVFGKSKLTMRRCTFVGNRNGVDDLGPNCTYDNCIFWKNDKEGGWPTNPRYEFEVDNPKGVTNCVIGGYVSDRMKAQVDPTKNMFDAPDPRFNKQFVPQNSVYKETGYRPTKPNASTDQARHDGQHVDSNLLAQTLEISVTGRDFNWYFAYPTKSDHAQVLARRNLYVPTNVPIQLRIESEDYLYSLALPQFEAQEIAVPKMTHKLAFTAKEAGVSQLVGDQFCGYSHPDLMGNVIALEPKEFLLWLATESSQENGQNN